MNKIISRFRNIVLSQSNVTNIVRILYLCLITFMVLLLILIWKSTTDSRRILNYKQSVEKYINKLIQQKDQLDQYALLCVQAKDEIYIDKYIEISSTIYKSSDTMSIFKLEVITSEEKTMLRNALLEIDNMIESDMYAINLIYLSFDEDFNNAHEFQKKFPLQENAYNLSAANKISLANELVLESFEAQQGKRFVYFFHEFDEAINKRLNTLFDSSWNDVNKAIFLMLIATIVAFILLQITLKLMSCYINKPIMQYAKVLEKMDSSETSVPRLTPLGTKELVMLADIINNSNRRMSTLLKVYAYGSSIADNFEDTLKKILTLIKSEFRFGSIFLIEAYDKRKFKVYTINGHTNEFDEMIYKAYAIPFFTKRIKNLNYFHLKTNSCKGEPVYNLLNEFGFLSISAFPLKSRDKNKRVLLVPSKKEDSLNGGVIAMMVLIAQHMSVVFENLKLYNSLYQQLQDRVQAQADMKKAKEEAEKANTAKTQFLATISHEIRTPLTSILGYSDLLSAMVTDEKQRGYIKTISSAGNLLLQLINDVLDMSKIEAGMLNVQYYSFNPRVVLREVEQLLHTKILAKGIDFIFEIDDNIPKYIMLSEIYLRQILINLLGNAVKFTGKGYVKLKAYAEFPVPGKKEVFDLILEITDTGIGIEHDSLQRIFEPFTQQSDKNNRKYEGSGLGLAISKNLVNVMNGTLSVTSQPGVGSAFTVKINNVFAADSEYASSPSESEEVIVFENSIAAVDEWLNGYTVLKDILQKLGVNVIPMQSLYELTEVSAGIHPGIVIIDSDDEALISKYEAIISFTIFSNAYILVVKKAGTDVTVLSHNEIDGFISRPFILADIRKTLKKYLYYTKADRQDSHNTVTNFNDANITYELKNVVLNEYVSLIDGFHGAIKLSGVLEFAQRLMSDGTKYECSHLSELGQRLMKSTGNYNMSDIRQDLNIIGKFIGFVKDLPL